MSEKHSKVESLDKGTFTIICNSCGEKQTFKNGDKARGEDIDLYANLEHTVIGTSLESLDITCENPECNHYIELKY
jgi:hypothetical protein